MLNDATFHANDPLLFNEQLSKEEKAIRDYTHAFAQKHLMPRILDAHQQMSFDRLIMKEMGEANLLGVTIEGYGCQGVGYVSYGLIARELSRIDSAYRIAMSLHSNGAMLPIYLYGTEAQRQKYLPKLAKAELIGSAIKWFEKGEEHEVEGTVTQSPGGYLLNGVRSWITHAPIADIFIVWAKDAQGQLQAFIVEKEAKGLEFIEEKDRAAFRALSMGQVKLKNVFVSEENRLPHIHGIKSFMTCLNNTSYDIAWGVLGNSEYCFEAAKAYVKKYHQLKQALTNNSFIHNKLADMQTKIALGLQACLRVGRLLDEKKAAPECISLIKRASTNIAVEVARGTSEIHEANGLRDSLHINRHLINLEGEKNHFAGSSDVHGIILGKAILE